MGTYLYTLAVKKHHVWKFNPFFVMNFRSFSSWKVQSWSRWTRILTIVHHFWRVNDTRLSTTSMSSVSDSNLFLEGVIDKAIPNYYGITLNIDLDIGWRMSKCVRLLPHAQQKCFAHSLDTILLMSRSRSIYYCKNMHVITMLIFLTKHRNTVACVSSFQYINESIFPKDIFLKRAR